MLVKRVTLTSVAVLLLLPGVGWSAYAYADDIDPSCAPVSASTGVQRPTGSDASTYTYNACTGLWENTHYTWNPDTKVTTPKTPYVYTYNQTTGKWDAPKWTYSPAQDGWHQTTFSVDQPPAGSQTIGGPTATPAASTTTAPTTSSNPENTTTTTATNNTTVDSMTNATLGNNITSSALTGSVLQMSNTIGGNAASGNAQAIANIMNYLQSSSTMGADVATFVANIDGDVQGDLIIDPNMLQPAQANANLNDTQNVDINIANNGEIANNITLNAASGDVTSYKNTSAGDATSGNAEAIANVVNVMNSMIAANQSFLGVVNINGNFNGNILMPEDFLNALLATNAPHETVNISTNTINNATVSLSNDQRITNNVTSSADSGTVDMSKNTVAGNATSGTATTNVTIFDLTNSQVAADNAVLVFVNVLGTWVGVIMNSTPGSTAALLGGGVRTAAVNNVDVNATNMGSITNNINVAAKSGNVTASKNTEVGNATSGNAHTAVNLANVTNSSLSFANWFGILFINVFGNWNGNFDVLHKPAVATGDSNGNGSAGTDTVFGFSPSSGSSSSTSSRIRSFFDGNSSSSGSAQASNEASALTPTAAVLGASFNPFGGRTPQQQNKNGVAQSDDQSQLIVLGAALLGVGMFVGGVDVLQRRRHG